MLHQTGEAISRLEGMAMASATNVAKFEKNINTKLEEMMEEVMQASLTGAETKAAVETVKSCPHPLCLFLPTTMPVN